jgi:flagellar basal-body rod protein FlgB
LISRELRGLERAMDGLSARFGAESANIANINTPGYARQDVNFEDALGVAVDSEPSANNPEGQNAVEAWTGANQSTDDMLELFQPSVTVTKNRPLRRDGNSTSLEFDMSQIVKTTQKYNAVATQIASQYRTFKYITDQK